MNHFQLHLSTRIYFGKGEEKKIGSYLLPYGKKVLLHYGGGSIRKSGLYTKITQSLQEAGISYVELGGVKPNPRVSLVREGIQICKKEKIELILAVGGGSVIDSSKAIGIGALYDGDVWDFYEGKIPVQRSLPVATVLTIPAAGSEMSSGSVLTNEETQVKTSCGADCMRPVLSVMNPELCMTLPKNQAAYGMVDMLAHCMERYFTDTPFVDLTDRMCEAVMRCILENAPLLFASYDSYDLWSQIVWAGTIAHNGILGVGRDESWVSHNIEHELSALYDIPHGLGLAIVFPAFLRFYSAKNASRCLQFAQRVLNVQLPLSQKEDILKEAVRRLKDFYRSLGLPTSLEEVGITSRDFEKMARRLEENGTCLYQEAMEIFHYCEKKDGETE